MSIQSSTNVSGETSIFLFLQFHHLICWLTAASILPQWYVVNSKKAVAPESTVPCTLCNLPIPTLRCSHYRVDMLVVVDDRFRCFLRFLQMLHYRLVRDVCEGASDITELEQIRLTSSPCLHVECRSHGFLSSSPCTPAVDIWRRNRSSV